MTKSATSSSGVTLMGSQEPSARIVPPYEKSDGEDARRILEAGGLWLDPWQGQVITDWMAYGPDGKWVATTCGGSVARQNGKTGILQGRSSTGMILHNEQVLYTAHLQKTATETFEEMASFFDAPKLRKYVKVIKTAIGREQIVLVNGARVKFLARTRNGGRGQHGDLLIFDEAQELDENQQASFLPAISASLNPQTIYTGTPPDPEAIGTVFTKLREKALSGKTSRTAWYEFSVPEIGDVLDRARWAATNPALGRRILLSTIEGEVEQMDAETFARERLGWWMPQAVETIEHAIDLEKWQACASMAPKPEGKTAFGVKFTADGSEVCLCGAVIPKEGPARISLIDRRPTGFGTRWLSDWLNNAYGVASCVVIDGRNGVDVLIDRMVDTWKYKGSIVRANSKDMIAAVGMLTEGVNEETLTWYQPQTEMDASARCVVRRPIGQGWGFGGEDSAPIEAAALALYGAKISKRDPNRRMKIG